MTDRYSLIAVPPAGQGEPFRALKNMPGFNEAWPDLEWHTGDVEYNRFNRMIGTFDITSQYFLLEPSLANCSFELRKFSDPNWRVREQKRFENCEYVAVPKEWQNLELPEDHFAHVSVHDGGIAFTENEDKGRRDIQSSLRAGKYIKRFFPSLSNEKVRYYASAVQSLNCLFMTDDPELAAHLYETGPRSCMKKPSSAWQWGDESIDPLPRHPVAGFFAGDLKLAWVGSERIAQARVLVWPEKKIYGRIYGAADRMKIALDRAGYRPDEFVGARLKTIRINRNYVVMPFLDGTKTVELLHKTQQLYIGTSHTANLEITSVFEQHGQNGLCVIPQSYVPECAISGEPLTDDMDLVVVEIEGRSGRNPGQVSEALARRDLVAEKRFVLTEENIWSPRNLVVTLIGEDGNLSKHRNSFKPPLDVFCLDNLASRTFIPIGQAITFDKSRRTHVLNPQVKDFVQYDGRYYRDLKTYYRLTGDKRKIVCGEPAPQSPVDRAEGFLAAAMERRGDVPEGRSIRNVLQRGLFNRQLRAIVDDNADLIDDLIDEIIDDVDIDGDLNN